MPLSKKVRKVLFFVFLSMGMSSLSQAHPHNWIDLNTRFVLDENARLVQVKQRWEFDLYYSLMMHADLLNEFGSEQLGLPAAAADMIRNLESYQYFSKLKLNDYPIELGVPETYQLFTKKEDGSEELTLVLEMTFGIKLETSIENKTLAFQVFDPTYYVAMNHATENNIEIIGGNATECSKTLEFPEPSDEIVEYAQSLDRTQKQTDGLGMSFAETAFINCI